MDKLVKRWDGERDADLMICERHGVAYQHDMRAKRVSYDGNYLEKVRAYEGTPIARAVNAGRVALVAKYLPVKRSPIVWSSLVDLGCGSGEFIRTLREAGYQDPMGFDVIPEAVQALSLAGCLSNGDVSGFDAVTAWDSLEHMDAPGQRLERIRRGGLLFVSVPVFASLRNIRESKHYRPGEHLYYWTAQGFIEWAALYGFRLLERSDHEVAAGRDSIGAFAFIRDLPDYNDHIALYDKMHSERHYGSSAWMFLDLIAAVVREQQPRSIIDYGCGRSDLAAHFWLDGARKIARYDPAIPQWKDMPAGEFDLAICCDVMEHIPMLSVDRVLAEVRAKSKAAVFTISTKLARAKLPDGRNAHVTLLTQGEWVRWVSDVFGSAYLLPSQWEHELIVCAGMKRPDEVSRCGCGGEMQLDSYIAPRKGAREEWFMRCRNCDRVSASMASTAEKAREFWATERRLEAQCAPAA